MTDGRRVAVVTGASSGIGAEVARELARGGWRPVLLARREAELAAVAAETGGEYEVCDVGDRDSVVRAATAVLSRHPRIAVLVNNAGIPGRRGFTELEADPARIEEVMRVDYLGSVWALQGFLPGLRAEAETGAWAHLVNVCSVAGTIAFPPSGPYCAAKHAQLAFSRAVSAELRAQRIAVHTVNPGFVETPGFPQRGVLPRHVDRVVIEPAALARHIAGVLRRERPTETMIPRYYRVAPFFQGFMPRTTNRVVRILTETGMLRG
jgi:NAD(P)-dependent dehydrogenase (short-subunit alcohol dehydrogenase family)